MKRISCIIALTLILIIFCSTALATNQKIPEGAYGIWSIPSLNIQLPIYFKQNTTRQQIIDAEESALIDPWANAYRIVDHFCSIGLDKKGVWDIQLVTAGSKAYLIKSDGIYQYKCYMTAIADVEDYGYSICGRLLMPASSKDILIACCVGFDTTHNYIAVFKFIKKF